MKTKHKGVLFMKHRCSFSWWNSCFSYVLVCRRLLLRATYFGCAFS